ncbi:hypothetical protein EMCRGX_G004500 [Ephydatia muelleri]
MMKKTTFEVKYTVPEGAPELKRQRTFESPHPASSSLSSSFSSALCAEYDAKYKDIESCFLGSFNIPVTCLLSPDKEYMVREADEKFIECLKHEMLENRTCDVAPIVATVRLSDEQFDMKHPEAYTYDTIGGNHSRIALQQLIKENQELAKDPTFSSRRVSVYGRLSAEQAQHLAHRHNRATEFTSKMNTQDKVHLCRLRLFTIAERSVSDEPPEITNKWRESWATTLMMTKKQLDENMIYALSSLSNDNYRLYQAVVQRCEKGKDKKTKKSSLGLSCNKTDCKGSNFRGLRGLSEDEMTEMLQKDLFLQLKSCPIPAAFNEYCAKALNSKLAGTKSSEIDARTAAVWSEDRSSLTILIPQTITMLCFEDIKKNVRSFGGCALTFVKDGLEKDTMTVNRHAWN